MVHQYPSQLMLAATKAAWPQEQLTSNSCVMGLAMQSLIVELVPLRMQKAISDVMQLTPLREESGWG